MSYKFEWISEMSVGEETIDKQHQKLLIQVNKVLEAVVLGSDLSVVDETIAFLDDYTREHFAYEEKYMRDMNYPEIEEHISQHIGFANQSKSFKEKVDSGISKEELLFEIEKDIGDWWVHHIGSSDHKYAIFAKSK